MSTRIYDYDGAPKVDYDGHVYYDERVMDTDYGLADRAGERRPGDAGTAVVSGGSMGGLFTALALRQVGYDATVYERTPAGEMRSRGAGIIAHPEMLAYLDRCGVADPDELAVTTRRIEYLDRSGAVIHRRDDSVVTTSWDTVYRRLRAAIPDDRYRMGSEVVGHAQSADAVEVRLADGRTAAADLLVVAEGYRSSTREELLPSVSLDYAGYIAYRGVVPEADLPAAVRDRFARDYTFFHAPDSQILAYPVPGPDGATALGDRRINWVWYYNVPANDLDAVLTDVDGRTRSHSLPPGAMRDPVRRRLVEDAADLLPDAFSRLVAGTNEPFVQNIYDLAVPRMVFDRACVLGDAAFFIRPHLAAGTAHAAADGLELARTLDRAGDDLAAGLADWERSQLSAGARLVATARHRGDIYTGRR